MYFSIVFENSGDSLPLETLSVDTADVLSYYVENLNNKNLNKFTIPAIGELIQSTIAELISSSNEINQWVHELLDEQVETYNNVDYLNQDILNKLHYNWVRSQGVLYNIQEKRKKYNSLQAEMIHNMYPDEIPTTSVGVIVEKLGHKQLYNSINLSIHNLENIFENIKCHVADQSWVQFDNPFSKTLLTNDISNFALTFNHLGRTLYNKFNYFDRNLKYDDENSFNELLGFVTINLSQPQTIPLSKEYIAWCNTHNKIPIGDKFNIGNIKDLVNNLTNYRTIIFQNTLQNNTFSIQLTKG